VDAPKAQAGAPLDVSWVLAGGKDTGKGHTATLKPEPVQISELTASPAGLHATAAKVGNSVKVEVKNAGTAPVLLGDAVAARTQPKDSCVGNGPEALLQPGETLVDTRPGLLSPSMHVWAAAFTGPKHCKWVEISRKQGG
jgi:hypothetical protein